VIWASLAGRALAEDYRLSQWPRKACTKNS